MSVVKDRDGILRIRQVREDDAGVYICEAENSVGRDSVSVTIIIESTSDSTVLPSVILDWL